MKNLIAESRKTAGWSQQELASMLSVSRQTVIALEHGKYNPSLPVAFRLARVFSTTIEGIFIEESLGQDGSDPKPAST